MAPSRVDGPDMGGGRLSSGTVWAHVLAPTLSVLLRCCQVGRGDVAVGAEIGVVHFTEDAALTAPPALRGNADGVGVAVGFTVSVDVFHGKSS
jgi:hypothetical protein